MVQRISDNNLLIRVYPAGIFYAITDDNEQVLLQQTVNMPARKLNDTQFLEHFFDQPELRVLSENVSIVIENGDYQLVPDELFREEDFRLLFESEFGKNEGGQPAYNLLPRWSAHLVFRVEEALIRFFEKKYPDAEIEHHIAGLLRKKVDRATEAMYANIRKEAVDLIVVRGKSLLLVNSFSIKTAEDTCFFILNAYEQLELEPKTIPLHLISEESVSENLRELIKQYIREVF